MSDKRLTKILALLAQAEGTNYPEEAKAFSAQAQKLMTTWEITDAQLAAAAHQAEKVVEFPGHQRVWYQGTMYKASTLAIWQAVADANGVRLVQESGSRFYDNWRKEGYTSPYVRGIWIHLFGFDTSLHLTQLLVASLISQMEREFRSDDVQYRVSRETTSAPSKVQWKNGFMFGFASEIRRRLGTARREAIEAAGTGTELVLVKRGELVDRKVTEVFPKLSKVGTSAGQGWNSSNKLGREAGARANVTANKEISR